MLNPLESPFPQISTNRAFNTQECSDIKSFIRPFQDELSNLNEEIARLQSVIDNLKLRRDPLQGFVSQHLKAISSSHRLPFEVLSQIFKACLPTVHYPTCDLTQAPLLFTTISRRFRDVAISTPELWSSIHVVLPSLSSHREERRSQKDYITFTSRRRGIRLWLDRSSNLPLSFLLTMDSVDSFPGALVPLPDLTKFLELFVRHHLRWKEVDLKLTGSIESHLFGQLGAKGLPLLESLILDTFSDPLDRNSSVDSDEGFLPFQSVLQRAPALRRLCLRAPLNKPSSEYRNLTHLQLLSTSADLGRRLEDDLLRLSKEAPNLQTLALASTYLVGTPMINHGDITVIFPTIQELEVYLEIICLNSLDQDNPGEILVRFFQSIHAPKLRRLSIELHINEDFTPRGSCWSNAPFYSLISRASEGQTLRELSLAAPMSFEALLVCLRSLSDGLESLEITEANNPGFQPNYAGIVKYLIGENDDLPPLPQLRRLALEKWTSAISLSDVVQLGEKRSKLSPTGSCVPLEVLRVDFAPTVPLEPWDLPEGFYVEPENFPRTRTRNNESSSRRLVCQEIQEMKAIGTDVKIRYPFRPSEGFNGKPLDDPYGGVDRSFLAMARENFQRR